MAYQRTRKRNLLGYVIGIPLESRGLVLAQILWQSTYYRNVVLISITDGVADDKAETPSLGRVLSMIYTSAQLIRTGEWKLFHYMECVVPSEVYTFKSAGNVWHGDEMIGTWDGVTPMPNLDVARIGFVNSYLNYLFAKQEDSGKALINIHADMLPLVNKYMD